MKQETKFSKNVSLRLSPRTSLGEALRAISQTESEAIPVIENGKFTGIFTREDALRHSPSPANSLSKWELNEVLSKMTLQELRVVRDVPAIEYSAEPEEAARLMSESGGVLAVNDGGRFSHLLSWKDLLRQMTAERTSESKTPLSYMRKFSHQS